MARYIGNALIAAYGQNLFDIIIQWCASIIFILRNLNINKMWVSQIRPASKQGIKFCALHIKDKRRKLSRTNT